jgi:hypothetical protein
MADILEITFILGVMSCTPADIGVSEELSVPIFSLKDGTKIASLSEFEVFRICVNYLNVI